MDGAALIVVFFQPPGCEHLGFGYLSGGGVGLLMNNGLLKQHDTRDREARRQARNSSGLPLNTGVYRPDFYKRVAAYAMIGVVEIERCVAMRRDVFECLANT